MHFWKSYICTNQLDVQETNLSLHSPTESEVSSSDAGLRMDGIPALDLWDLIIEVLHSYSIQSTARGSLLCDEHEKTFQRKNEERVKHVGRSWLVKY